MRWHPALARVLLPPCCAGLTRYHACVPTLRWRRQCAFGTCCRSFHVLCARGAGQQLAFRATDGEPLAFCELHSRPAFEKLVRSSRCLGRRARRREGCWSAGRCWEAGRQCAWLGNIRSRLARSHLHLHPSAWRHLSARRHLLTDRSHPPRPPPPNRSATSTSTASGSWTCGGRCWAASAAPANEQRPSAAPYASSLPDWTISFDCIGWPRLAFSTWAAEQASGTLQVQECKHGWGIGGQIRAGTALGWCARAAPA